MEPTRLFDFFHYQKEHFPQAQAIGGRSASGEWVYYSTDEVIEKANQVSRGLLALGVQPGDKIALVVYKNRPEWTIMDLGLQQIGAVNVPVYPTISPAEYEYIFNDAGVKLCFAGEGDLYDKVNSAKPNVATLENIYTLDPQEGRPYWEDIFKAEGQEEVEQRKAAIQPAEMATIIYTSGTTGNPKGVMLSHNNIVSNVTAVKAYLPIKTGEIALSFLPLCHIFERTASYSFIYNGINVVFTARKTWAEKPAIYKRSNRTFSQPFPVCWKKYTRRFTIKAWNSRGSKTPSSFGRLASQIRMITIKSSVA